MSRMEAHSNSCATEHIWSQTLEPSGSAFAPVRPNKRSRVAYHDLSKELRDDLASKPPVSNDERRAAPMSSTPMPGSVAPCQNRTKILRDVYLPSGSTEKVERKRKMQTGCIPCLAKGVPCNPHDPRCKLAMSDDWALNQHPENNDTTSTSLSIFRPDTKWRRSWRERHSLNFFVNFSAPQLAGFFDSGFWQRMVIQASYNEPSILHAITGIGALHEAIMQRAFADEKRKVQAMEFALSQCNKAIACLTISGSDDVDLVKPGTRRQVPSSRLALTTCVLFTCFEAMQGRCDSAVNHALQGRRLLQAASRPHAGAMPRWEEDNLEQMRPLVERLEVQATALIDKGKRLEAGSNEQASPLPQIDRVFSLDHAHYTLHTAMNSIMRFTQGFQFTARREDAAKTAALKYERYGLWFQQWEVALSDYLAERRESMSNLDVKRAMVLKANHLFATMLVSVDQSAGPTAYDAYETEFRAIVDLSREVLASFSCPPLPTLSGATSGASYLSFALWVTEPLWMAITRCCNPCIRQAAFTLLSQNPRQEGIWHAGPQIGSNKYMRRVEAGPSFKIPTVRGDRPPDDGRDRVDRSLAGGGRSAISSVHRSNLDDSPTLDYGKRAGTSYGEPDESQETAPGDQTRVRREWVDMGGQIS